MAGQEIVISEARLRFPKEQAGLQAYNIKKGKRNGKK